MGQLPRPCQAPRLQQPASSAEHRIFVYDERRIVDQHCYLSATYLASTQFSTDGERSLDGEGGILSSQSSKLWSVAAGCSPQMHVGTYIGHRRYSRVTEGARCRHATVPKVAVSGRKCSRMRHTAARQLSIARQYRYARRVVSDVLAENAGQLLYSTTLCTERFLLCLQESLS